MSGTEIWVRSSGFAEQSDRGDGEAQALQHAVIKRVPRKEGEQQQDAGRKGILLAVGSGACTQQFPEPPARVRAAPLLGGWSLTDSLAVGAGFGYYSLSSIFIADLRGPELATIALLCNVMREIFTLLAAPLVARWCGPLAAVSIGGATTFDTTLPVITQAAGRPYAVVSIFHGCALDFSVPFLVTFFCTI